MTRVRPDSRNFTTEHEQIQWTKLRRHVFKREAHQCFWCAKPLTFKTATLDHLIPRSQGGIHHPDNVVLACSPCNVERDTMPAQAYLMRRTLRAWTRSVLDANPLPYRRAA